MPLLGREKVDRAILDYVEEKNDDLKGVYFSGLSQIIAKTPADKGEARNSWRLSVNAPNMTKTSSKSKTGTASTRQLSKMPKWILGKKIYFTNNAEHIGVLEYGGFPSPVKKGSYIKKSKSYQILSVQGFSKQAPNGWVRSTLKQMQNKIRSL